MERQPEETIIKILEFCDAKSICIFGQTCESFHNISNDERLWKELSRQRKHPKMEMTLTYKNSKIDECKNSKEWYKRMTRKINLEIMRKTGKTYGFALLVKPETTIKQLKLLVGCCFQLAPHNVSLFTKENQPMSDENRQIEYYSLTSKSKIFVDYKICG